MGQTNFLTQKCPKIPFFSSFYLKKKTFLRFISKMDEILFSKLDISATNGPIDLKFGLEHVLYLGVSQNKISWSYEIIMRHYNFISK